MAAKGDAPGTQQFLAAVLAGTSEGICVVDRDGAATFLNPAAQRLLGYAEDELMGRQADTLLRRSGPDDGRPPLRAPSGREELRGDGVFVCKDGSSLPVTYSVSPLLEGGEVTGAVVSFHELSQGAERDRLHRQVEELEWLGRVREALEVDAFALWSQPIIRISTREVVREELLVRIVAEDGEIVPPARFLPVAEKYGLVDEVDAWVIRQAVEYARAGRPVEVNLSAESVADPDLLSTIERELDRSRADAAKLVFETTETALMRSGNYGERLVHGLAALGCGFALDDFGTGFGSFTYLKRLPIRHLKIDVEFVHDVLQNEASRHVVQAVVNLAQGFGQETTAEGVEDERRLELLHELGVDYAQGFHLGEPKRIEPRT